MVIFSLRGALCELLSWASGRELTFEARFCLALATHVSELLQSLGGMAVVIVFVILNLQ